MGLQGMIGEMVMRCDKDFSNWPQPGGGVLVGHTPEAGGAPGPAHDRVGNVKGPESAASPAVRAQAATKKIPVLGITGTGGAGKSSLTDELIRRLRLDQGDALRICVISIDPSGARAVVRCWATASA